MEYILVIWTIVASSNYVNAKDWRPMGEFKSLQSCTEAGHTLVVRSNIPESTNHFRCLKK